VGFTDFYAREVLDEAKQIESGAPVAA
jgi:hypothetical protein